MTHPQEGVDKLRSGFSVYSSKRFTGWILFLLPLLLIIAVGVAISHRIIGRSALKSVPQHQSAATPEQALKFMAEAAAAGDIDGYLGQFEEPSREALIATRAWYDAMVTHQVALDERFGKDETAPFPSFKDSLRSWKNTEIIGKDPSGPDRVVFKVKRRIQKPDAEDLITDDQFTAVKRGTAWKLRMWNIVRGPGSEIVKATEADAQEAGRMKANAERWAAATEEITTQIKQGKFNTRQEAWQARLAEESKRAAASPEQTETWRDAPTWLLRLRPLAILVLIFLAYLIYRQYGRGSQRPEAEKRG